MACITVYYACPLCDDRPVAVDVIARPRHVALVDWWRDRCVPTVQRHHATRAPDCRSQQLEDVTVPYSADGEIGCADWTN